MDIVAFIKARVDEDEQAARAAIEGQSWSREPHSGRWRSAADGCTWGAVDDDEGGVIVFDEGAPSEAQAAHIAHHDPARVLREVQAKRQLLAQYAAVLEEVRAPKSAEHYANARARQFQLELALPLLALPYSDHPDYRQEWSP